MKTKKNSKQGWKWSLVALACFALVGGSTYGQAANNNAVIGQAHKLASESTCPLPVAEQDSTDPSVLISHKGKCVLNSDVVLDRTIELGSFTILDCRGHKISALNPSDPTQPTTTNDATASNPEVGILLKGAYGATVQNCIIDGFDFGIAAYDIKTPSEALDDPVTQELLGIKIKNNTVNAKSMAIRLANVDNGQVTDNEVNIISTGGVGIGLMRDNDNNLVNNNTVTRLVSGALIAVRRAPGRFSNTPANPFGILFATRRSQSTPISIIGEEVVQLDSYVPGQYNEDNVIENNTVDMKRGTQTTGVLIGIANSENTAGNMIRGNTVMNAVVGIQQGMQGPATEPLSGLLPSTCSGGAGSPGPAGRPCNAADECNILELGDTAAGTCSLICNSVNPTFNGDPCSTNADCGTGGICGFASNAMDDPRPRDTVLENNVVSNSVDGISTQTALGFLTIRGNNVSGANRGMNLGGSALNSGTLVTRNILSGNGNGLFLTNPVPASLGPSATSFGAQVTLNDITGSSVRGVTAVVGYSLLNSDLEGNYWNRTSCPGFIPGVDSNDADVFDSAPYITPVAATGTGTQCP